MQSSAESLPRTDSRPLISCAGAAKEQTSSASIDEDSIQALNSRISRAEPVRLPEDTNSSVDPTKRPEDSQLAASLNQRLKELSVASVDERSVSCTGNAYSLSREHYTMHARLIVLRSDCLPVIIAGESLRGLIEGKYGRTYGESYSLSRRISSLCLKMKSLPLP